MRPVTVGWVPEAAVYGPPSVQQMLGSLPVVASFLDQLGVAAIIDGLCPVRDVALATHGQVIEAMIANRLTSPTPLVRVIDWAREWAVGHCFGIAPEVLNDDRLGRAPWTPWPRNWTRSLARSGRRGDTERFGLQHEPGPLGHDLDVSLRRLPGGRSGVRHPEIGSPKGPPPGSEADPDRDRDQR